MNTVGLVGRLTADPELRYTPDGTAVCNYTLAVRNPFRPDEADFVQCVTWKQLAEMIANTHRKGDFLAVNGRLQTRNFEDNNGIRRYVTEVNTDQITFVKAYEAEPEPEPKTNNRSNNNKSQQGSRSNNGSQKGSRTNGNGAQRQGNRSGNGANF